MTSQSTLWIAIAVIAVVVAAYVLTRGGPSVPGQPPPHAIDQSQKQ